MQFGVEEKVLSYILPNDMVKLSPDDCNFFVLNKPVLKLKLFRKFKTYRLTLCQKGQ